MFFINLNFTTVYQHHLYTFIVDTLQIISSDQYKDHKTQQQNNSQKMVRPVQIKSKRKTASVW